MKRIFSTAILVCALGVGRNVMAQAGSPSDWNAFQALSKKNIFDPTRNGTARYGAVPKPKIIRYFTFLGTFDNDTALFTGEGAGKGYIMVGQTINGFKVMKIPRVADAEAPVVILTDPGGAVVELKQEESMRREDEGAWGKSDETAPATSIVSTTEPSSSSSEVSTSSASPGPVGESDVLRKLRLRREQEDK